MGVLNVTPDSFSDGGRFTDAAAAAAAGADLAAEGAAIIDVGGDREATTATDLWTGRCCGQAVEDSWPRNGGDNRQRDGKTLQGDPCGSP